MSLQAAILTASSVLLEWRMATGRGGDGDVAAFLGLDPALGWAGNLRRPLGPRVAVRRGARRWSYAALASDTIWHEVAGPCADGEYAALLALAADHIRVDTRPDDTLRWQGDPADRWPWAALVFGATIEFSR